MLGINHLSIERRSHLKTKPESQKLLTQPLVISIFFFCCCCCCCCCCGCGCGSDVQCYDREVVDPTDGWFDGGNRFRASQYTVTFGDYDLRSQDEGQSEPFQVSEIRVHPRFTGTGFYNDLALFKLSKPVRFTQHIQPICLPSQAQRRDTFVGQVPTIIGWGTTYYGNF